MNTTVSSEVLALSKQDAARSVGCSTRTLEREIAAGRLAVKKIGRRTVVERSVLLQWLANQPAPAANAA